MRDFFVCGLHELGDVVLTNKPTHVISLLDPSDKRPSLPGHFQPQNHLFLQFEDDDNPENPRSPTLLHVKEIFDWVDKTPPDAFILVHCFAGISRSTATAFALHFRESKNLSNTQRWLVAHRPKSVPNKLIAAHCDKLLNANGQLVGACEHVALRRINWLINN